MKDYIKFRFSIIFIIIGAVILFVSIIANSFSWYTLISLLFTAFILFILRRT